MCVCDGGASQTAPRDLVTLKTVALWGRGGAGRDGEVELADGGWLGGAGPLIAALTDL